jgi:uncharacterized protein (DUF302 family)
MSSYYIVETEKNVDQACEALQAAVVANKFGVLHVHNLKEKMNSKGVEFAEECRVFEVCNPFKAAEVLQVDLALNMALPCRISVYSEKGVTKIGMIRPACMLALLSTNPEIAVAAEEVEAVTTRIIDTAAAQ